MDSNILKKDCEDFARGFLMDTLSLCKEHDLSLGHTLHTLQQKLKLCQVLMLCFMTEARTEESIATIYGDMKSMSLEALDGLIENPDIFTTFCNIREGEPVPEQSTLDTVELFKSLRQAMKDGPIPIKG